MTATLKIRPDRLPFRGEPTRNAKKPMIEIPDDVKVIVLEKPKPEIKQREKRKQEWRAANRKDLWTAEQDEIALSMWLDKKSYEEIANAVNRGVNATYMRLLRIRKEKKIPGRRAINGQSNNYYSPEDDQLIIRMHNEGHDNSEIARILGRSPNGIKCRMSSMRKRGIILQDHRLEREK